MSRKQQKTLIIKLGHSETLLSESKSFPSLGDVFRTTVVLHLLKSHHVTWLTDAAAIPLLDGNPHIERLLPFDHLTALQLENEQFDKVINLEKIPGVCALADRISAWSHFGFRLNRETGQPDAYDEANEALVIATREDVKKLNNKPWAAILFAMLGAKWNGENCILGYKPTSRVQYDLGFNTHVGKALPVKAWPTSHWQELDSLAGKRYSVGWQQHLNDLRGYMEWIHACRMLITNDSLGMYLGVAMGKKVLGIFGPTSASEQSPHENLRILTPPLELDCIPCCNDFCAINDPCIAHISPQTVLEAIDGWQNSH